MKEWMQTKRNAATEGRDPIVSVNCNALRISYSAFSEKFGYLPSK